MNRKRAPPSPIPGKIDGTRTPPTPAKAMDPHFSVPPRASTFPTHVARASSNQPAGNAERTATSSTSGDSPKHTHLHPWMTGDPSPLGKAESVSSMSPAMGDYPIPSSSSASSLSSSKQQQQQQQQPQQFQFPNSFENPNHLPDLMPMMFPSGDPFAYPNQPMSTLEDGHFKHDRLGTAASNTSSMNTPATPSTPSHGASFSNAPIFPGGSSSNAPSSLGLQTFNNLNQQSSGRSQHLRSPSGGDAIHNPDLVSMPNQPLSWQGLSLQSHPQLNATSSQTSQPRMSQTLPNVGPDMGLGIGDFGDIGMGVNMGMGMNLDEIFGNSTGMGDDWAGGGGTEWMDLGGSGSDDQTNWM